MATQTDVHEDVEFLHVDPKKVLLHPRNPRRDATADDELLASVKSEGVRVPVILGPIPDDLDVKPKAGQQFVLLAGHRRLDAATRAKRKTVPAVVYRDLDTLVAQLEMMARENVVRQDLSPLEEGDLYLDLQGLGVSQARIHADTGVGKPRISERARMAGLPVAAREKFTAGQATQDSLLRLAQVPKEDQERISKQPVYVWDHEVDMVRRASKRAKALAKVEQERTAARSDFEKRGVQVLDSFPPDPGVDDTGQEHPDWAHVRTLLYSPDEIGPTLAERAGVEYSKDFELVPEDLKAWHLETCEGHAVVEQFSPGNDWAEPYVEWEPICTTPAAHGDLFGPSASLATTGARSSGHDRREEPAEAPETRARRAHLKARRGERARWLAGQVRDGSDAVSRWAWQWARDRMPRLALTDEGDLSNTWQQGTLEARRTVAALPNEANAATVEEKFHTVADDLTTEQLLLLYSVAEYGPAYGSDQMGKPGGFGLGWAEDRVRLLHILGWTWDEQELDEIRKHPKLAASLDLTGSDEVEDGAA